MTNDFRSVRAAAATATTAGSSLPLAASYPRTPVASYRLAGCHDCGTLQRLPSASGADLLSCAVCDAPIERTGGRSFVAAFCFAAAGLLLLVPANLLIFMTTAIAGVSRESVVGSSVVSMVARGYPELAVAIGLAASVLPLLRLGLLSAVLAAVLTDRFRPGHLQRHRRWLGPGFRCANALQTWAMADVFLLGFLIAYARLRATISVELGTGAVCFIAAALLGLLAQATLDIPAVWRRIANDRDPPPGAALLSCGGCDLLLPAALEGSRCPRCGARLRARKPNAVARAAALTVAAAILYVPANLYPMATLPIGLESIKYTVLQGAIDLVDAKLYALALVVFLASFAIPLLKLVGLSWCIASVLLRSRVHLAAKTRLYRVVEQIGRWSMVDPFVIACFVPVTQYNALIHGSAEPAVPVFTAVVLLTMLAARCFDPRLMWDAATVKKEA